MRYPSGDLAILSAESYDDGRKRHLSSGKTQIAVTEIVVQEPQEGSARKRRKTASPDAAGEEEEKKRSRGRPRLEPKDETAQDRRRTQIRLAQRAYRNRKENAIQTLERRVQELKDTNEEMNNAFLRLHDYAVGCGLLDRMPEVGRQLRETTQKFLALARKATSDAANDDEHNLSRDSDSQKAAKKGRTRRRSSSPDLVQRTEPPQSQGQLFGGLVVTQEQVSLSDLASSDIASSGLTSIAEPAITPPDYEVITYPTLDNASFPFGFTSDFSFPSDLTSSTTQPDFSTTTTTQPDFTSSTQHDFPDLSLSSSLYPSLPLPNSCAAQEVTFGRRFQRTALERAWTLVTMPNPPQKRFARVFGFCLLFEPLESIKTRLRRGLDRTTAESLNNWQYPFLQLGNSTNHFDLTTGSGERRFIGNQGTQDVLKPRNSNGFGMGPFDVRTTAARDMLEPSQCLPPGSAGFGAEFYDCDEIEMYLHQRGVVIPPAADYVTVEIEGTAFTEEEGATAQNRGRTDVNPLDTFSRQQTGSTVSGTTGTSDGNGRSSPGASSGGETAVTVQSDMWRFEGEGWRGGKKQVTVDVNLLIFEMVERATCLGRSPGLRKEDINGAFWTATKYNS